MRTLKLDKISFSKFEDSDINVSYKLIETDVKPI